MSTEICYFVEKTYFDTYLSRYMLYYVVVVSHDNKNMLVRSNPTKYYILFLRVPLKFILLESSENGKSL